MPGRHLHILDGWKIEPGGLVYIYRPVRDQWLILVVLQMSVRMGEIQHLMKVFKWWSSKCDHSQFNVCHVIPNVNSRYLIKLNGQCIEGSWHVYHEKNHNIALVKAHCMLVSFLRSGSGSGNMQTAFCPLGYYSGYVRQFPPLRTTPPTLTGMAMWW